MSVDERGVYSENMVAFGRAWPVVCLQVWVWQSACVCVMSVDECGVSTLVW